MPNLILGFDPGMGGAIALYDPKEPKRSQVWDMPKAIKGIDAPKLSDLLGCIMAEDLDRSFSAIVENVGSRPRQAGAFNFGLSTGIIHGVLATLEIPFTLVTPTEWKGAMGLTRYPEETQDQNKQRARLLAIQLFPGLAEDLKLMRHDGRAEALLMAVYFANRPTKEKK